MTDGVGIKSSSSTYIRNFSFVGTVFDKVGACVEKEFQSWSNFSLSRIWEAEVEKIALGSAVGVFSFFALGQFEAILSALSGGQMNGSGPIGLFFHLASLPNSLAVCAMKVATFSLFALVVPYVEEFMFRGVLHELLNTQAGSTLVQGVKVCLNAALFALFHIPAMLPQISLLFLFQIFLLGVAFSLIRTCCDSRVSSTAAHITYNSLILATIFACA